MYLNFTLCQPQGRNRCYEYNGELLYHDNPSQDCITPLYGLNEIKLEDNSITLYPNPTRGELHIQSDKTIKNVNIYSASGQKVMQSSGKDKSKNLNLEQLPKGIYILNIEGENQTQNVKVIKE